MRIFLFTIIAFFLLIPESFAETNNRAVAKVNDDVITLYELNSEIEALSGKTCEELQAENEQEFFNIRSQILDGLITEKLIKEKARELEVEATREQVDDYIESIKKKYKITQEELVAQLEKEGLSYKKWRKGKKSELDAHRLFDREIREKMIVTEDDIAEYYESHKKEYEKPGKAHIASIFLVQDSSGAQDSSYMQKKGEEILARLKKGDSFSDLAREFSNGPGAEDGGDLGNITLTDVDPKILEVIYSLKEGEVSSLIDMGNRLQIIKLIKRSEAEPVPLEEIKEDIARSLYNEEWQKRSQEYIDELKKDSYIKIIL